MTPKEKEELVIASIKSGADTRKQIAAETGLPPGWVNTCLRGLFVDYNAPHLELLKRALTREPSEQKPVSPKARRALSHDYVVVDKALAPAQAANYLTQVLGKGYCSRLIDALMIACTPGAPGEGM